MFRHNLKKKKKKNGGSIIKRGNQVDIYDIGGEILLLSFILASLFCYFSWHNVYLYCCVRKGSIIISHNRPPPLYSASWVSLLYIQLFIKKKRETLFYLERRTTFVLSAATILCCWPGKVPRVSTSGTTSWTGSSVIISRSLSLSVMNVSAGLCKKYSFSTVRRE